MCGTAESLPMREKMLIAVMSDTHDHIWNLRKALEIIKNEGAQMIIHCGDFTAPFMLTELQTAGIPVHGVFGNNDGEQYKLTKFSHTTHKHIHLHDLVGNIEIEGYKIGFTHRHIVAEGLACTGRYDLVCFGHSHEYFLEEMGTATLLNPGELLGKNGDPGFCFVNTDSGEITGITFKRQ